MELLRPAQFKCNATRFPVKQVLTTSTPSSFLPRQRCRRQHHEILSISSSSLTLFPRHHHFYCYAALDVTSASLYLKNKAAITLSQVELDPEVLCTSLGASASLFSACALVVWMQKSGYVPPETPVVLSQVAFRILIPCYLMSKVARVLATQASGSIAIVPLIAILQVLAGVFLARVTCILLYGTARDTKLIAKKKAIVTTACAFGNALSLPLIFLNGVLPPQQASLASGYLALFVVGWSPSLWTVAYQILKSATGNQKHEEKEQLPLVDVARKWYKRIVNPPLFGVFLGALIGLTPLSQPIFYQKTTLSARLLKPVFDAVVFLGSAAPAVQVTVLACSLAGVMKPKTSRMPHLWGPRKIKSTGSLPVVEAETVIMEGKELLAVFVVRSVLFPLLFCVTLSITERLRLVTLDPICKLTLMVLAAMPSAQNLVVLAQLRSSTRPLAKEIASLLLIQYTAAALVPIPVWLAVFLSMVNV